MYLREVDRCLALVCLISEEDFHKRHLIDYNIECFKVGLKQLFSLTPDKLSTAGQKA